MILKPRRNVRSVLKNVGARDLKRCSRDPSASLHSRLGWGRFNTNLIEKSILTKYLFKILYLKLSCSVVSLLRHGMAAFVFLSNQSCYLYTEQIILTELLVRLILLRSSLKTMIDFSLLIKMLSAFKHRWTPLFKWG